MAGRCIEASLKDDVYDEQQWRWQESQRGRRDAGGRDMQRCDDAKLGGSRPFFSPADLYACMLSIRLFLFSCRLFIFFALSAQGIRRRAYRDI